MKKVRITVLKRNGIRLVSMLGWVYKKVVSEFNSSTKFVYSLSRA